MDRWTKMSKHGGRMYDLPRKGVGTGSTERWPLPPKSGGIPGFGGGNSAMDTLPVFKSGIPDG